MKRIKDFYDKRIKGFFEIIKEDKIGIHTGQSSFFIVLSIFPFLLLLLNIISLIPSGRDLFLKIVDTVTNESVRSLLDEIIMELSTYATGLTISISAIIALWSASKGVHSLMLGLGNINNLYINRNYFIARLLSMLYTIAFMLVVVGTMGFLVFGNTIVNFLVSQLPKLNGAGYLTMIFRYFIMFIFFLIFFLLVYRFSNRKYTTIKKVFWGALFCAVGWIVFSLGFNIYIDNFFASSYMYGSLTSFIILMLWTYFCIYIFFLGHEINKHFYPEIKAPDDDKNNSKIDVL